MKDLSALKKSLIGSYPFDLENWQAEDIRKRYKMQRQFERGMWPNKKIMKRQEIIHDLKILEKINTAFSGHVVEGGVWFHPDPFELKDQPITANSAQ